MKSGELALDREQSPEGATKAKDRDFLTAVRMPNKQSQVFSFFRTEMASETFNRNKPLVRDFWDKKSNSTRISNQRKEFEEIRLAVRMSGVPRFRNYGQGFGSGKCRQVLVEWLVKTNCGGFVAKLEPKPGM
jgi:hypothetical protein